MTVATRPPTTNTETLPAPVKAPGINMKIAMKIRRSHLLSTFATSFRVTAFIAPVYEYTFTKTEAQTKRIARSKLVNKPSTRTRTGNPKPATNAPTMAAITIEISGDFNFQLDRTKAATMAASTIDVVRYTHTP